MRGGGAVFSFGVKGGLEAGKTVTIPIALPKGAAAASRAWLRVVLERCGLNDGWVEVGGKRHELPEAYSHPTAAAVRADFGTLDDIYDNLHRVHEVNVRGAKTLGAKLDEFARRAAGTVADGPGLAPSFVDGINLTSGRGWWSFWKTRASTRSASALAWASAPTRSSLSLPR